MKYWLLILFMSSATLQLAISSSADNPVCGEEAGNAPYPFARSCSRFGYCSIIPENCGTDWHRSRCNDDAGGVLASIVTPDMFDLMFSHRNDSRCSQGNGFYTYKVFVNAAKTFHGFGTKGDNNGRGRDVAAFLAQTSHETAGGWPSAPDGPNAWGYCFVKEKNLQNNYCDSNDWPCPAGRKYYGRGPIQLSHNYNYGLAGRDLGLDRVNNPDILAMNAIASFRSAIWFLMTAQGNKPSIHNVITGSWILIMLLWMELE